MERLYSIFNSSEIPTNPTDTTPHILLPHSEINNLNVVFHPNQFLSTKSQSLVWSVETLGMTEEPRGHLSVQGSSSAFKRVLDSQYPEILSITRVIPVTLNYPGKGVFLSEPQSYLELDLFFKSVCLKSCCESSLKCLEIAWGGIGSWININPIDENEFVSFFVAVMIVGCLYGCIILLGKLGVYLYVCREVYLMWKGIFLNYMLIFLCFLSV